MVDDRRARIRRNMARAWAFAASAYQASAGALANISWDLYGNPVGLGGGLVSATLSTPAGSIPTLVDQGGGVMSRTASAAIFYFTTASFAIGTASANRRVIVAAVCGPVNFNTNIAAASIGGVAATIHYDGTTTSGPFGTRIVFSAIVPSGTTAGMSISYAGGVINGSASFRIFTVDNSALQNPSPQFAVNGGFVSTTVSLTASTDAVSIILGARATDTSQVITVSPSSNVAYTYVNPEAFQIIGYANNLTSGVKTVSVNCVTASDSVQAVMMIWR